MALWTVQMMVFNVEADSGEQAYDQAWRQIVDNGPDLELVDMQGWPYRVDFSEEGRHE